MYHPENPATPGKSSILRAALTYAKRGKPVFPCKTDKTPHYIRGILEHGHNDARTDAARIRAMWSRYPRANIGMPTGERTGGWVLDVDPGGLEALEALEREHGKLPATLTVRTPRGGMHLHFEHPGAPVKCSAGELGPGLDVRGDGGYVLVPPSEGYEWIDRTPRVAAPDWLLGMVREPERSAGDAGDAGAARRSGPVDAELDGPPIPDGARNRTMFKIGCALRARGLSDSELLAALEEMNVRRCTPPLDAGEVRKVWRSVGRYPAGKVLGERDADTREVLDRIERVVWERSWPGMGGKTDRDCFISLLIIARRFGRSVEAGVHVSVGRRTLALASGCSLRAVQKAVARLEHAGMVRPDNAGRSGTEAGALILVDPRKGYTLTPSVSLAHSESGEPSVHPLRAPYSAPRLRWSAPRFDRVGNEYIRSTVIRLGKSAGAVLDALERRGGTATLQEVAGDLGIKRARDLRRRAIARLEAAGVIVVVADVLSLSSDWLEALNRERELTGELEAHRRDMARYAREREAYRNRNKRPESKPTEAGLAAVASSRGHRAAYFAEVGGEEEVRRRERRDRLVYEGVAEHIANRIVYGGDGFIGELERVAEGEKSA